MHRVPFLLLVLALVPAVAAQDHAHGGGGPVRIVTHLADPAVTYVGSMNGFTALALGDDEVPDFHQDLPLRITLDGAVVFQSDADSGHDYDGVQTVWVVFPRAGKFEVQVLGENDTALASLAGTVLPAPEGGYSYSGPGRLDVPLGGGSMRIESEGTFDAWADVRSGARVVATATLHAEDGFLEWAYVPPGLTAPTTPALLFDARPSADEVRPAAVLGGQAMATVVGTSAPRVAGLATTLGAAAAVPTATNAVIDVTGDGLRLLGTYDPWTRVGTETLQNLAILALGPDGSLVDDLRLDAALVGPHNGIVWSSTHILEHDGIWEFASIQAEPGVYVLHAEATSAVGTATIDVPYLVTPPADPAGAGPVTLGVDVPPQVHAGEAVPITVTVTDAAGAPFDHSEVLLDVFGPFADQGGTMGPDGKLARPSAYTLRAKLHTHADGKMSIEYAFPLAGEYTLWLSPSSLEARPVAIGGAPVNFAATTVQVTVPPAANSPGEVPAADAVAPGAGLLVAALAGLGLALRRKG